MANTIYSNEKITKAMVLEAMMQAFAEQAEANVATVNDIQITGADVIAYCEKTIEQLNAKADKAKEKAAEKKVEGDALREAVQAVLTTEYQDADQITEAVGQDGVTRQKVIARLTQLVKAEIAEKDIVKVDKSKKTVYRLVTVTEEVPAEEE